MANPQPQNFPEFSGYSKAIEESYPGWDKLPHDYQEEYMGHAKRDWQQYHQVRQNVKAVAAAQHRPGATPGEGKVAGPPEPRGMFRDPTDVMGYKPRTEEQFAKDVYAPVNRVTQTALAGLFEGPNAMKPNWDNPGDHPYMQAATSMVPLLGAKTSEDARLDALLLTVDPALKLAGFAAPAMEGSKFLGPLARYATRTGISGGAGVAAALPTAIEKNSAMPLFSGFAKGAVAQQFSEAGSALFGISRKAITKGFQSDIIQSIAGPGAYFKEYLGDKLKSWNDFSNYFLRTDTDKFHNAVSTLENQTADKIGRLEKRANHLLTGTEFEVRFPEEAQEMLRHKKLGKEMDAVALQPREAKPQQDIPAGPRRKNPLWVPGPQKKGAPPKAPYWTAGSAAKTIPSQTAIETGTYRITWDKAFQAMRNWEKRGWSAFGVPERGQAGMYARSLARFMRNELATQASAIDKGLGTNWLTAKTQEEAGHLWTNIFSHEGVLAGLQKGDASTFQKVVAGLPLKKGTPAGDSYMNDIIEILGSQDGKAFLTKVMHGGTAASPKDVVGAISPYIRAHVGGIGAGFHPTAPYVGPGPVKTQVDVGREAWGLLLKMGGAGLMRMIRDAISDPAIDRPGDRRLVTG